jgi:hypothetical protein
VLEAADFAREEGALTLSFLGDRTSAGAVFRDAARVDLVAGAAGLETTACFVVVVAARTLFLETARSEDTFSLSSLVVVVASSLLRFFARVEVVGTDLEGACLDFIVVLGAGAALMVAAREVEVVAAGAARVLGAGASAGAGMEAGAAFFAGAFFVGAAFLLGAAFAGAGAGSASCDCSSMFDLTMLRGLENWFFFLRSSRFFSTTSLMSGSMMSKGLKNSSMVIARLEAGTRLTRRSRRDRRLAH